MDNLTDKGYNTIASFLDKIYPIKTTFHEMCHLEKYLDFFTFARETVHYPKYSLLIS
jgi:hypothetical protein